MAEDRTAGLRRWREQKDAQQRERARLTRERGELLAARVQAATGLPTTYRPNYDLIVLTTDEAEGWLSAQ